MMTVTISTLDADALLEDVQAGVRRAEERIARAVVSASTAAINSGRTPQGGAQKKNAVATTKKKNGKPALLDTGRLRDGARLRTTTSSVEVVPPADRSAVVASLEARGYHTIWGQAPPVPAQQILDDEMRGIRGKGR
jgi:hypothetical protein